MKTTLVIALDEDTASFLEAWQRQQPNREPAALINQLLRQAAQPAIGSVACPPTGQKVFPDGPG